MIRLATVTDSAPFMTLAADYLTEIRALGSEIRPTQKTMEFWRLLFDAYTDPENANAAVGICGAITLSLDASVLCGFSIAGSTGPTLLDTDFGHTAYGWGTYVVPAQRGKGISGNLRAVLMRALRNLGFDTITGGVHVGNAAGHASLARDPNYRVYQICGYERLTARPGGS